MKVVAPKQDNQSATIEIRTNYGEVIGAECPYRDCKEILDSYHRRKREGCSEMMIILLSGGEIERRFIRIDTIVEISITTTKR